MGGKGEEARTVAREVTQIFGEFNVSDFVWVFKKWDVQGFRKRYEAIRGRYDALIEQIITEREEQRKKTKKKEAKASEEEMEINNGGEREDFLSILLDAMGQPDSEIKISRVHIKALILVSIRDPFNTYIKSTRSYTI